MAALEELREAIQKEVFITAESGKRIVGFDEVSLNSWIFDFRALLLQPRWLEQYAEIFWERFSEHYPFQVCGMESAAISLVSAIIMKSLERGTPVNGLFIRKTRKRTGLLKQLEGSPTKDPIILVDDLINTGITFGKQKKILNEAGLYVSGFFALIRFREHDTYANLTTEKKLPMHTVFSLNDFGLESLQDLQSPNGELLEVAWKFSAPNPSHNLVIQKSTPALCDGKVYFGSDSGIFYALEQTTGEVRWTFRIGKHPEGKGILSSPAVSGDKVYFGAYDGNVYALDSKTGAEQWVYSYADWVGSSPCVAADIGALFIGLEFGLLGKQGGIVALDLKTGKEIWRHTMPAFTHASPLYIQEENLVVIGSNESMVYAYQADTGAKLWRYRTNGAVKSSFVYDKKRRLICFGSLGGQFYAISARDGLPVYSKAIGGMYSTPCIHKGVVYFSALDKNLYAVQLDTWKDLWSFQTNGRVFASPTIVGGSLWLGSNDGCLYEVDIENGTGQRRFQAIERIVNEVRFNDEKSRVFLTTQANEIYCLKTT